MNGTSKDNLKQIHYDQIFEIGQRTLSFSYALLHSFNSKQIPLKSLPTYKRSYIFFLTRSIKTFSAIQVLCQNGFGQDIAALLRNFLENLISVKYILIDLKTADQKATRFVEYKWIIFKRYISETNESPEKIQDPLKRELVTNKGLILQKIDEFKKKYKIISDKALITWSGRSVRDMAKMVGPSLLEEYDLTFRLSSRFSHPSIIGDREYINYEANLMVFSCLPSSTGVHMNFEVAITYLIDFLEIFDSLFELNHKSDLAKLKNDFLDLQSQLKKDIAANKSSGDFASPRTKDPIIKFLTP